MKIIGITNKISYICTQIYDIRMDLLKKEGIILQKADTCQSFQGMSAAEAKRFCAYIGEFGASARTIEDRIRYRGFSKWEQLGISTIIRVYADYNESQQVDTRDFLCHLGRGERVKFYELMSQLGMCANTVRVRFFGQSFRPWELLGTDEIYRRFKQQGN